MLRESSRVLSRRLACFEEHGFVIIDDFENHPLLPRMAAAGRSVHALSNAKVPLSLDTRRTYVHRASEMRGESKDAQWTGTPHVTTPHPKKLDSRDAVVRDSARLQVFKGEEAWAIRGILHPDWREYLGDEQEVWSEFLGSEQVLLPISYYMAAFSMENRHFSGAILHYFCIFNRKSEQHGR